MKRIHEIWIVLIVVGAIAFILFPVFDRARFNDSHHSSCQSNLKQLGLGFLQYTQDYDEKLPLVKANFGWADGVYPYVKSTQIYQCYSEATPGQQQVNPRLTGYTDYYYNAQLANRWLGNINDPARLIMAADGNDGHENTNSRYAKIGIPEAWRTDSTSPAFRHLAFANYLFADGHVKAVKVEGIATNWSATKYYFQPPKASKK